jgi:hypothetical protein
LNRLNPRVDIVLQRVEETAVVQEVGWQMRDVGAHTGFLGFLNCSLDNTADDELYFRNLDVLLKVERRQLELGKLLLRHRDTEL